MRKSFLIILILTLANSSFGQSYLTGYAPDFVGKTVKLLTYQDYVTMNRLEIGEGAVSAVDSTFKIELKTNSTIKGIIEIERTEASLYIAPKTDYSVYFPKSNEPENYQNVETNLYFGSLDTTDINYRILQYHQWFDSFIYVYGDSMKRHGFTAYLDTFKLYAGDAYKHIDDPYFITYVRYDLAEIEQTMGGNSKSEMRLQTFLTYIEPFPVYYENDRYMKFITAFYDKEFREYLPVTEDQILEAIYLKSPTLLMQALKSDIFLANPNLRELVMIDKLGKAFYNELELRPNILAILDSVSNHANTQVNATVAANVKKYITNLEPGYPAPAVLFKNSTNENVNWTKYKGKFIYFNFFATWNDRAMNDMEIISKLVPKYDEDIAFVSVCTDKDAASYTAFLKEHPEYNWDIFYVGEDEYLMKSFKVTNVPNYYLIDQEGFIFAAPAKAPSPNGEYESIEKTLFQIQQTLHPQESIRVGEK